MKLAEPDSPHELPTTNVVLLTIANFFSLGHAHNNNLGRDVFLSENGSIAAYVFAEVALIDLTNHQSGTIECRTKYGTVRFMQIEADKITVSMDDNPQHGIALVDVESLEDLVALVRKDIKEHLYDYVEAGAIEVDSISKTPKDLWPRNIVKQERVGDDDNDEDESPVKKITYRTREVYYFKPIVAKISLMAAIISGIPKRESRFAERSMFTYVMSEILGFHLVPHTVYGRDSDGKIGYIQKEAKGVAGEKYFDQLKKAGNLGELKCNNDLIRQMILLQLFDALMGQVDRHINNYYIDEKTNTLTAIDNDASNGYLMFHPDMMIYTKRLDGYLPDKATPLDRLTEIEKKMARNQISLYDENCDFREKLRKGAQSGRCVFLPPVMDTVMVKKFEKLSEESLVRYMSYRLYEFDDAEIDTACKRLHAIKFHINVLKKRQEKGFLSIIDPREWSLPETIARLMPNKGNSGNALDVFSSYFQRDFADMSDEVAKYKEPAWVTEWNKMIEKEGPKIYEPINRTNNPSVI